MPIVDSIIVGDIRARAVRERGKRGPHDGRIYWRAEQGRESVWRGWATREECLRELAVIASGKGRRHRVSDLRTVRDLLDYWVGTVVDQDQRWSAGTIKIIRGRTPGLDEEPRLGGSAGRLVRDLGDVSLERLDVPAMVSWRNKRLKRGDSAHTMLSDLTWLRVAWQWGREVGATPDRPLPHVEIDRPAEESGRTPTPDEVARVARWLRAHAPRWAMPLLLLQAATGARISEVAGVRWCDIDGKKRTVRVDGKTGPRVIHGVRPDVLAAVHLLRDHVPIPGHLARRSDHEQVVWGVSRYTADEVSRYVDRACEALGIERWTTHGIRRMCVDTALRNGAEIAPAARMFGHSPMVMWARYRRITEEDLEVAAETARLGVPVEDADVIEIEERRKG
jgi:integrase